VADARLPVTPLARPHRCYPPFVAARASLAPSVATALARFRAMLDARLGARVQEVVVFGSHARGTATEASDVDVYVVIDDATHQDRQAVFDLAYDVDATAPAGDDGWVGLEPVVHSTAQAADMRARERGLLRNIDAEGIVL
jgi:predicted nucleotidyltransferase